MQLTTIHNMYGTKYYVKQEDIDSGRIQIPLYHQRTKRRFELWEVKDCSTMIHRSNICPHPIKTFETVSIFGETWKECPECRKTVEGAVKKLQKEA